MHRTRSRPFGRARRRLPVALAQPPVLAFTRMRSLTTTARRAVPPPLQRSLHRWRVQRQIAHYDSRTVTHHYAGEELRISLQDPLAEGWYDHDWERQPEIEMLRRGRLRSGARVFDLGAHQGVVALLISRIVGSTGEVVAVEAEPHNVRVAKENIRLNGATNLRIIHAAVADQPGRLFFAESLNGSVAPGGRTGKIEVDAVTVDGLADRFGAPDVVFIDVEGYEAKALEGARSTLERCSSDFFVEVHDGQTLAEVGASADEVVRAFDVHGYRCVAASATQNDLAGEWQTITDAKPMAERRSFLIAIPS